MGRRLAVALTVLMAGCGRPLVEYDAVRDRLYIHVNDAWKCKLDREKSSETVFNLLIAGEGKHPRSWNVMLTALTERPKDDPNLIGNEPCLVLPPEVGFHENVDAFARSRTSDEFDVSYGEANFNFPINKLADLLEYGGKFTLNDHVIALTKEEQGKIRAAIVAARECSNAGK